MGRVTVRAHFFGHGLRKWSEVSDKLSLTAWVSSAVFKAAIQT